MAGRYIDENVKRKLYAESLGRCMNPNCQRRLFLGGRDISEKAHIVAYCKTEDNAYENLVLLCPNCHTEFDKNNAFSEQEILGWKRKRQRDIEAFFGKKYATFDDLRKVVAPILQENKTIYEEYYLKNQHQLWDKCEENVLVNNRKLKTLFSNNMDLFQEHANPQYSNLAYVMRFMVHVEEFETTRLDEQKNREILFPQEIDSMFGVAPVEEHMIPSTEALEVLTRKLQEQGKLKQLVLGCPQPYLNIKDGEDTQIVYLDDTPRLRQLYFDYDCFCGAKVRLKSLNFAMQVLNSRNLKFEFVETGNLRKIKIKDKIMIFVYEYCLSQQFLMGLMPPERSIIVNLHNWNGPCCVSDEAYQLAEHMNVRILTMENFYLYVNTLR